MRRFCDDRGRDGDQPVWRRLPAVPPDCPGSHRGICLDSRKAHLDAGATTGRVSDCTARRGLPRKMANGNWLITAVLRNVSTPVGNRDGLRGARALPDAFRGSLRRQFEHYPESQRPFGQLDAEEQSLALLYRESATWAIGHGCAAGWDVVPSGTPDMIQADVFPAVELPSVTTTSGIVTATLSSCRCCCSRNWRKAKSEPGKRSMTFLRVTANGSKNV